MDDSGDESPDPEAEAAAAIRARSRHALSPRISRTFTPRSPEKVGACSGSLRLPTHVYNGASLMCTMAPQHAGLQQGSMQG